MRWRSSRNSPSCSASITVCRMASRKRRRTVSSRELGLAYAINDRTTFRAGAGRFLNRVQINTTAAYGFNAPLSEMQTVINGIVDAPGGASTRNFPLVWRMQSPDFTNPTSWAWNTTVDRELPWAMRGALSYVGPLRVQSGACAQHQPAAGRARFSVIPGSTRTRSVRILATAASRCTRRPAGRSTTAFRRRSSGARHAALASASRTRSRGPRTTAAAAVTSCRMPMTTAATTASRISIARTCWYRRCAIASRRSSRRWRRCGGCSATGTSSGIFQAQSGAPFDIRTPAGVDVAGVGPGSGNQFYDQVWRSARRREPIGIAALSRAVWFDRNAFRAAAAGTFATTQEKNSCASLGSGTSTCRSARASTSRHVASVRVCASRRSTSSTARVSEMR